MERLATALADRYLIERELGQGGMATVYLAHDVRHDRKVALKVLRPELSAILGGARFLAEIKTTANLQHPHILGLFDSGEADGTVFYVMPYVEGESLRDRLVREKQLPVDEAVRIAREVADALEYAHQHKIVHRDIKPENILLHGGHAMVADFGIALAASRSDGGTRMTETGMSLGTPHYMSPEQSMGEREITPRADIYALGCVLYEMLAGEPPFTGPTAQAIIARVMTEEPRSLTLQRRTIPPHVEAAVHTALAKLPADRFATAAQFAAALADVSFAPTLPGTAVAARSVGPSVRRSVALAWGVAAVTTIAAAAGWLRRDSAPAPIPVRFYHVPDSGHSITSACCGMPVAISPDGRRIAYEGIQHRIAIWVRDLDQLTARPLPGTEGARGLFFAPDGQWIGFVANNRIMKVPVAGGAPVTIVDVGTFVAGATWTGDHQIVYARLDSAGLYAVTADGGVPRRILTPDSAAGQGALAHPHAIAGTDALLFAVLPPRASNLSRTMVGYMRVGDTEARIVSPGSSPQYAAGHLLTLREGNVLVAQRFDARRGDTSGPLVRLADGIIVRAGAMAEYAVSATGTLVHPVGSGSTVISLLRLDGSVSNLTPHVAQVSHFDNPRFSPDGRQILFAGFHDQESQHVGYVLDMARGSTLRLTFDANTEYLDWTPDGRRIVYRKGDTLAARRSDRGGEEEILLRPGAGRPRPNGMVSAGGAWLAFATAGGGGSDIWALRLDGRDSARAYLATPFSEVAPALSRDGRWIAFVSEETGRAEVYVSTFPAAGPRTSVSVDGGSEPRWSPDGRAVYFRNESGEIVAAQLRAAAGGLTVESRRVVVRGTFEVSPPGAEYDVDRSGRLAAFGSDAGSGRLVVVVHAVRKPE
jgi:eukaryotic-like serine/threonine-protein kinase